MIYSSAQTFDVISQLDFTDGVSDVGRLSRYHPDNRPVEPNVESTIVPLVLYPLNVTAEYYQGAISSREEALLGALVTKYLVTDKPKDQQYVDPMLGAAGRTYLDIEPAEICFGSQASLGTLARVMGLEFQVEETQHEKRIATVALERAEDINDRLKLLNVQDRRFIDFSEGMFSAQTFLEHLEQGVIPLAQNGINGVHDKIFHLMGYVLLAPEAMDLLKTKAHGLLADLEAAKAIVGDRPAYEFSAGEPVKLFKAKDSIRKFMAQLDFDIPSISFKFEDPAKSFSAIAYHLEDIGFVEPAELDQLTAATIAWAEELTSRGRSLKQLT